MRCKRWRWLDVSREQVKSAEVAAARKPLTERLIPADNAGLGLARAAAVARILSSDQRLAGVRILPFSGGQLVDVGDRRADGASSGNGKER